VRLTTATGKSYRLESTNTDFTISADVNAQSLDQPSVVNHGDVALTVWRQGTTLIGRYYQISTGQAIGNPFNINSTVPATNNFIVKAKNGKAVIVWENGYNLYASVKDLSTLASVVNETLVVTRLQPSSIGFYFINPGNPPFGYSFDVSIGNDRAAIVWNDFTTTFQYTLTASPIPYMDLNTYCMQVGCTFDEIKTYQANARILRLDTGAFQGGNISIWSFANTRTGYFWGEFPSLTPAYQIDIAANANDNNHLVYAWNIRLPSGGDSHTIYSSVYNLNTGTKIGSTQTILSESTRPVDTLQVGATTGRGMILWRRNDGVILGRGIDTSNSNLLGASNIEVESGAVDSLKLNSFGDRGLLTYRKNGKDLFLKVLDLQAGQLLYSNGLSLAQATVDSRSFINSVLTGNKILTTWDQINGARRTNWGRVSDLSTFTVDGPKEFQISTTNEGVQYRGTAIADSGFGLVAWVSQDKTQQRIRGAKVDLANPGALKYGLNNFFVSPLIERDYTVRAKIKY
ncbi:hypothetical protein QMM53_18155, partial [Leptospira santarosai]|nr:hypothetical protein [Leptospira santarosai]